MTVLGFIAEYSLISCGEAIELEKYQIKGGT